MPRGRKGSPQESIDSILLAISRRDDIDTNTLSHYFDRLDEEWEEGAREKVLHLLRTTDKAAHAAAILILSELATDFDLEELEDFVTDPTVGDLAKLTMVPLLKELGSEMADDGIVDYLNDPNAAMLQMQMHLLELVGQSELGVESILEDVISMPQERRLGFIQWLGSSQDSRAARLLIPLLEVQASAVVLAAIDALEELGTVVASSTIPALNYLIAHTSNRQVKQQARTALGRLTMQSSPGLESSMLSRGGPLLPLHEARVSFIDGTGSQMIMLAWERPDGLLKGVNILYKDDWGIKDCYGTDEMSPQYWTELVSEMAQQNFDSLDVPLAYCRSVIAEALVLNKRTRHKVPIAYSIWRPFIEGEDLPAPKKKLQSSAQAELQPFNAGILDLSRRGSELYQLTEFSSWLFDPLEGILEYINRYWSHPVQEQLNLPRAVSRQRKSTKKQKEALKQHLDTIIKDLIKEKIDDNWRNRYCGRLLRQTLLFRLADRNEDAELSAAVASTLNPSSAVPAEEQSFITTMLRLSIEHGPIHLMASALDISSFDPQTFGIDLFPPEK